ncbi:carbamoyltransferase HypF, partial [Desulfovibrio sp. OttesenSCG-928-C14]|nr:carbamoyltransferase HypF [Desulfovibrio sp. OttesenSCG-928-C14]
MSDDKRDHDAPIRKFFIAAGQVQGVGFRPFVHRLAGENCLSGTVRNGPDGVRIEVQGRADAVLAFKDGLLHRLPPLARITALEEGDLAPLAGEKGFSILSTSAGLAHQVLISPDTATCADCLEDMRDPANRRYAYPFTNCTNCGPRYTITRTMPYDRAQTSMACFPLCPACAAEYSDPSNRRFHAQPNACPICGPQIWFEEGGVSAAGKVSSFSSAPEAGRNGLDGAAKLPGLPPPDEPETGRLYTGAGLEELARRLILGQIAAIKGLGGFHLACDASSRESVRELRRRKNRPHKPLAVMVADLESAQAVALLGEAEKKLLASRERPIVLCPLRPEGGLAPEISPDTDYVGLMLPYTPLHHLLLGRFAALKKSGWEEKRDAQDGPGPSPAALVMTSGNAKGEPIALGNREAKERLGEFADCFLFHNRDILIRADDSVLRPIPKSLGAFRTSSGADESAEGNAKGGPNKDEGAQKKRIAAPTLAESPSKPESQQDQPDLSWREGDAEVMFLRRARGFTPLPLPLPAPPSPAGKQSAPSGKAAFAQNPAEAALPEQGTLAEQAKQDAQTGGTAQTPQSPASPPSILGLGAELKNTICLTRGGEAFVSQHLGDLQNLAVLNFQEEIVKHLRSVLQIREKALVSDEHPDFTNNLTVNTNSHTHWKLQHHFAHAEAVLCENQIDAPALILTLDGSGYTRPDLENPRAISAKQKISDRQATVNPKIWGGELLYKKPGAESPERIGTLKPLILPGGEKAILEPWRIAQALLLEKKGSGPGMGLGTELDRGFGAGSDAKPGTGPDQNLPWLNDPDHAQEYRRAAALLPQILERRLNCPQSTSCGRVFDAVAAILGLCNAISYEGQAAIRLEAAQGRPGEDFYSAFAQENSEEWNLLAQTPPLTPTLNPESGRLELDTPTLILHIHKLYRQLQQHHQQKDTSVQKLARLFHYKMALGLADLALAGSLLIKNENEAQKALSAHKKIGAHEIFTHKNPQTPSPISANTPPAPTLVGLSGGVMQN